MNTPAHWPIWAVVLLCGVANQFLKLASYSVARHRLAFDVLVKSTGLPSLHAATLTCLAATLWLRRGWSDSVTGVAVVLAVVVIHDAMRLKGTAEEQRRYIHSLLTFMPNTGTFHQRVAGFLDVRGHHPVHVVTGVLFGLFFALAFGLPTV